MSKNSNGGTMSPAPASPPADVPTPIGQREPVAREVPAVAPSRAELLRDVAPEAFVEGKIDFDRLRRTLGQDLEGLAERYSFGWAGKGDALRLLRLPGRGTLAADREQSVNFDSTANVFVEGDNLEVLRLLLRSYFGRVKMIYIDPPYNTGGDRVYQDSFADPIESYLRFTGQKDEAGNLLTSNPETSGRYHSAWLTMLYPRLFLARQLLRDDGVIFVSIDDHEVHNLRLIMNEVFGEENFVAQVTIQTNPKGRVLGEHFALTHDYLLVYTRTALDDELGIAKTEQEIHSQYRDGEDERGPYRLLELRNTHRQFGRFNRPNLFYPLFVNPGDGSVSLEPRDGQEVLPLWDDGFEGCWSWGTAKVEREHDRLVAKQVSGRWKVFRKAYPTDDEGAIVRKKLKTIWTEREYSTEKGQEAFDELIPGGVFQSPKPVALIRTELQLCNDPDALVLDFFAGSGTTAQAVLEQNRDDGGRRQVLLVQLPEPTPADSAARKAGFANIADIAKERIRRAIGGMTAAPQRELAAPGAGVADLGFRVFKLTASHYRPWTDLDAGAALDQRLALYTDPLLPGWSSDGVLWEIALKEGFSLSSIIGRLDEVAANVVYRIRDQERGQVLLVCLDERLDPATSRALKLGKADVFICRDVALTDELAANLALQCRLKTI